MLGETKGFIRAVGSYQWATMTTVFAISHVAYLLMLPAEENPAGGGVGLVIYLVFLTQFNDVAQYIWGKKFGNRKIVPAISPNKTWAGFIGGVATTTLFGALLAPWLTPLPWWLGLGAGLLIGLAGFIGDLNVCSSDLRVSGQARPAHQGHQPADSGPRRHSRPYRQPDVHRAAVLPLPRLHHLLRSPCPCSSACPNSCSFC